MVISGSVPVATVTWTLFYHMVSHRLGQCNNAVTSEFSEHSEAGFPLTHAQTFLRP